jgi:hypothetical protein
MSPRYCVASSTSEPRRNSRGLPTETGWNIWERQTLTNGNKDAKTSMVGTEETLKEAISRRVEATDFQTYKSLNVGTPERLMDGNVRWTVKISKETDIAVRTYLARRGMKKGDLSKFIEEAVRWRVFDRVVSETKARNKRGRPKEIQAAVDEALGAVRARRGDRARA